MCKLIIIVAIFSIYPLFLIGQQNLAKPFEDCKLDGSITIFDYHAKKWISSDIRDSHFPTLPASTFKIINTLIALECDAIEHENEKIKWPGYTDTAKYGYRPKIYRDMSMKEAFKTSAGWAYIELAKKIGKENYQKFLTESHYGNVDLSINDEDFWNFGNFAISPVNQIEILTGIYEETLPFKKKYFAILKDMMIVESTENYTIRAKTGWTRDGGKDTGWWVGYIEKKENVYFFATRVIKDRAEKNSEFGKCRKEITMNVLQQLGMME